MIWWKSNRPSGPPEDPAKAGRALVSMLRSFGNHGFDTDEMPAAKLLEHCERWATLIESSLPHDGEERENGSGRRPGFVAVNGHCA